MMSYSESRGLIFLLEIVVFTALLSCVAVFSPTAMLIWNTLIFGLVSVIALAILSFVGNRNQGSRSVFLTVKVPRDIQRAAKMEDLYKRAVAIWGAVEKKNQRPASQMIDGEIIFRCANMVDFADQYKSLAFVQKD
ncbi:hypothetical protein RYA05_05900 [Pseudomonas syringae pv. actinidiae]|nr:hypothetical protein [Pseudomonas syringae pv. actinidiae]